MARILDNASPISSIRQGGVDIPIPDPAEVKALLARNRSERALLRSLLGLALRTAEVRNVLANGSMSPGRPADE
jgi:hypothetical protein